MRLRIRRRPWNLPPAPITEIPLAALGVHPGPAGHRDAAGYRALDGDAAITRALTRDNRRVTVVHGPRLAGSTRALAENARRHLPGHTLLLPVPDPALTLHQLIAAAAPWLRHGGEAILWLDALTPVQLEQFDGHLLRTLPDGLRVCVTAETGTITGSHVPAQVVSAFSRYAEVIALGATRRGRAGLAEWDQVTQALTRESLERRTLLRIVTGWSRIGMPGRLDRTLLRRLYDQELATAREITAREAAAREDAAGKDATRSDGARSDAARSDGARSDAARSDGARSDAARSDAARSDAARSDAARSDAARSDAARSDATQPDAARSVTAQEAAAREAAAREAAARETAARETASMGTEWGDIKAGEIGANQLGVSEAGVSEAGVSEAGVSEAGVSEAGVSEAGAGDLAADSAEAPTHKNPEAGSSWHKGWLSESERDGWPGRADAANPGGSGPVGQSGRLRPDDPARREGSAWWRSRAERESRAERAGQADREGRAEREDWAERESRPERAGWAEREDWAERESLAGRKGWTEPEGVVGRWPGAARRLVGGRGAGDSRANGPGFARALAWAKETRPRLVEEVPGGHLRPHPLLALAAGEGICDAVWRYACRTLDGPARLRVALSAYDRGEVAESRRWCAQLADTGDPALAPVMLLLGSLALDEGDSEEARRWWRRTVDTDHPESAPPAMQALGHMDHQMREWDLARYWYHRALGTGHADVAMAALLGLARVEEDAGDLTAARHWRLQLRRRSEFRQD
ncbi:hypothetical protein [Actinoplanes sp. NPDC051494]|uniref:hypothetical protein n=1 Tax=Actinoplanes sp. NPDC051494 TaxID=3363907 RepID=UPI0037947D3E